MNNPIPYFLRILVCASLCGFMGTAAVTAETSEVRHLAGLVKPGATKNMDAATFRGYYLKVIARMRATWLSIGLRPAEQLDRAMKLNGATGTRVLVTRGTLVEAYDTAEALGLFTPEGLKELEPYLTTGTSGLKNLSLPKAKRGTAVGNSVTIKPFVPPTENKGLSVFLANWRLAVEGEQLSPDAQAAIDLDARNRKAALIQAVDEEKDKAAVANEAKEEKKEEAAEFAARFAEALTAAEGKTAAASSLNLRAQLTETAAKQNGERVKIVGQVSSSASVPAQGKLEWYLVGRTEKRNRLINIGSRVEDLKLLPAGWKETEIQSMGLNSDKVMRRAADLDAVDIKKVKAPRYLGWILRVTDAEGNVLTYKTSGLAELDEMAKSAGGVFSLMSQAEGR